MFIGLRELEQKPVRFTVDVPVGEIDYDGKVTQTSALHAEGTAQLLTRTLSDIRINGKLTVGVNAPCDRCLEDAAVSVDRSFDLVYLPVEEAKAGGEDEVEEDATEIGFYEGNGLQLNDVLREVVLLALPMQLVCRDACKGICPECGQNRNNVECGCQPHPSDDRWSKLKSFRADVSSQN